MTRKNIDIEKQTEREIATMRKMIAIYCKGNHSAKRRDRSSEDLCPECQELFDYALFRIDHCPVKKTKTFCSECKIHCYQPDMRENIREVMRYSGPRMLLHAPIMAIRHLIIAIRSTSDPSN